MLSDLPSNTISKEIFPFVGQALCRPCKESGVGRGLVAAGMARFNLKTLLRHAQSAPHKRAVLLVQERASRQPVQVPCEAQSSFTARELTHVRVMVETRGSFRNFETWSSVAAKGNQAQALAMNRKQARCGLQAMAAVERALTQLLAMSASAFRLQADGLGRIYQVELGMVIWKWPTWGHWLHQLGDQPGLLQLGERGPWLVERVIGARELPADLDTAGKVDAVAEAVMRACSGPSGEVNVELHQFVRARVLAWSSDGADVGVGHAATAHFENMAFREWEESHSAVKVFEHAVQNHREARTVDGLLVSGAVSAPFTRHGRKPPSLAKFVSTSEVFKKRCTEAQRSAGVALCENFGWAPQRYTSRARPMAREARRWGPIWDSLAEEVAACTCMQNQPRKSSHMRMRTYRGMHAYRCYRIKTHTCTFICT